MVLFFVSGRRDIKPFVLKLSFALALSFAGFLAAHLRCRRHSDKPTSVATGAGGKGLKDELRILRNEESFAKIIDGTSTTTMTTTTTTTFVGVSPTSRCSGDDEGFLLPEFNDLVSNGFESSGQDGDATQTNLTPKKAEARGETAMEQEVVQLKNLVLFLRERERSLELQMLEYYGLQEQESIMRELVSQVKINKMELKLFSLKIESLQAENQRLRAELLDYSEILTELDAAKAKVMSLKRQLRTDGDEAEEKMAVLQQTISMLQSRVDMYERDRADFEWKLKRLKELENEALSLRILNSELDQENLELNRKLEDSLFESPEAEAFEEARHLREKNDKLSKELEQLQTERCTDLEELVYLRWVNACLRYELRNYQAPPGKTVARDLSKTLSPKSEEKAKQLIVEYANSGTDEKRSHPLDSDMDYSSSSQVSAGESDETSNDTSYAARSTSSKSKFLSKLKKLVLGKDNHGNKAFSTSRTRTSCSDSDRRISFSTYSVEDLIGRDSCNSRSSSITEELSPCNQLSRMEEAQIELHRQKKHAQCHGRPSLDVKRMWRLNLEEDRERKGEHKSNMSRSHSYQRVSSLNESSSVGSQTSSNYTEETDSPEKIELKKFAEVLKKSQGIQKHKRWSSSELAITTNTSGKLLYS